METYKCPYCGKIDSWANDGSCIGATCTECRKYYFFGDIKTAKRIEDEPKWIKPEFGTDCHGVSFDPFMSNVRMTMVVPNRTSLVGKTIQSSVIMTEDMLFKALLDCHALLAQIRGDDPGKARRMVEKAGEMYARLDQFSFKTDKSAAIVDYINGNAGGFIERTKR